MSKKACLVLFVFGVLCLALCSGEQTQETSLEKGARFYDEQWCLSCHNADGMGSKEYTVPSIAGLPRWYVAWQLRRFRDGYRGKHHGDIDGARMQPVTERLTDTHVIFIAKYVSQMAPNGKRDTGEPGDPEKGGLIYKEVCVNCHMEDAGGNRELLAAPLNRQPDWYLYKQMKNFQHEIRGDRDNDSIGKQMNAVMDSIDLNEHGQDLAAYISRLEIENEE